MRGFLTKGYCLRTVGYCFPKEILWGKAFMKEDKVVMGDTPSPPPTSKNPEQGEIQFSFIAH